MGKKRASSYRQRMAMKGEKRMDATKERTESSGKKGRIDQVAERCHVQTKKTIYQWMAKKGFPRPRRLGGGQIVLWDLDEVDAWIEAQPRTSADDAFGEKSRAAAAEKKAKASKTAANDPQAATAAA